MKAIALTQHVSTRRTLLVRALAGVLGALAAFTALPQKAEAGVFIGVGVSVGVPPPPLPIYEQPMIPGPGYIWTPGYWAWDGDEYYWVPGTWILAPFYGALWTPGYWGWDGALYVFHAGYWGYHVGFYGGINYGCGYGGRGYDGGYWGHGGFYYNRTVNHINNVNVTNVYNKTVINNVNVNRVSYNGGRGGVAARATPQQLALAHQSRMGPIAAQQQQMNLARQNPAMRLSANHGDPPIAATQRAGAFAGAGVAPAAHSGGSFTPAAANTQRLNNATIHAPQAAQPNNSMALRSANFAPHANMPATPNATHPSASYSNLYRPGGVTGVAPTNHPAQPVNARPMNTYRAPSTAYHPAPAPVYRPQPQYQYHAPPAPQYHAYRPAPAPAPHPSGGGAPRGGNGGGRDTHHG
ncbi:YXWGXW repeat-containing protein [Dyella acidisoli]|uniref:YXWGXW repeat-containing protein n=1 Tax=Dyella acidisoli TaxID=1867834 RepID=A0ABQ5XU65_9GAMM|nr:hypothetical protein [Dyella acidisoli]GLQ94292.1 hypothetical protein GCM10007901_32430 [Dyella acidisoli]